MTGKRNNEEEQPYFSSTDTKREKKMSESRLSGNTIQTLTCSGQRSFFNFPLSTSSYSFPSYVLQGAEIKTMSHIYPIRRVLEYCTLLLWRSHSLLAHNSVLPVVFNDDFDYKNRIVAKRSFGIEPPRSTI